MRIKAKLNTKCIFLIIILLIQLTTSLLTNITIKQINIGECTNPNLNEKLDENNEISDLFNHSPKTSEILHHDEKLNLSDWWNNTYKYRIGFKLEEPDSIDRYQPIDIFLTFRENEYYENTSRLVSYNATGKNEWSNPIPIQIWNVSKYQSTNFIQSCFLTFVANISANSNKTYFLYFNDNKDNIEDPHYMTDFSSVLSNGKLNVSVGPSGSNYKALFEEGLGVSKLIRDNINFHTINSLIPERQLTHPSLKLLAHCDEGSGTTVDDSSGNNLEGELKGNINWASGVTKNGLEFDGNDDYITFGDVLNNPIGSTSKQFTISAWIKPKALTSSVSNHGTMNCFIAKASEPYNDNLELGIERINNTHGLLHVYISTINFDNQSNFGDIYNNPILINEWNFIAVKYDEGNVDVRINDVWYTKDTNNFEPWNGAIYLDQASGSHFTLGATINVDTYFNGTIDEIAIYNISLSNNEIDRNKLGFCKSSIESITELENGEIFSRYQINWTEICDMHVQDIITLYNDYNLWNINRSIYFDNHFDPNKASMNIMNTYYNFSDINNHQKCMYIYDGIIKQDITTADFTAENYTIIHNAPNPSKSTIGIFIAGFDVSDNLYSSINNLKGKVTYSNNGVRYTPGSVNDFDNNIGGEDFKLYVNFWEFIDSVNQSGNLDEIGISRYFNNTLTSLKHPINVHIFHQNSQFFNLKIYVEDIDENPVNEASVLLYNLTNDGNIDTCIATQKTGINGYTTFLDLKNGTYTVNVTFEKYNQPAFQIIPKPINITVNESIADLFDNIYYNFFNVSLTSLKMTLQRVDPKTQEIKEFVVNANISFWINNGSGEKYIGSELTDDSGKAEFHWSNFTSAVDGNVTFTVIWYDEFQIIGTEGDLTTENPYNITLHYYDENIETVNVSSYEFSTALVEYVLGTHKLGEEITFRVNYTYTINYTNPTAINDAKIYYYIEQGGTNISSMLLEFIEPGSNGTYETKIDTDNPEDPEIDFMPGVIYTMHIYASKACYIPKTTVIVFELVIINTKLTPEQDELEVYWRDNLTLSVYYEKISPPPNEGIEEATVNYSVIEMPGVNGTLPSNGTGGWYKLELNSTVFVYNGTYNLKITADKPYYENMSILIPFTIYLINTKLTPEQDELEVYWKDNLTLSVYYEKISPPPNEGIEGATVNYSVIEMPGVNGTLPSNGTVGWYKLELNSTVFVYNGTFNLKITAGKQYYEHISVIISITIHVINTKINNSESLNINIELKVYIKKIFYFNYTIANSSEGISNSNIKTCNWDKIDANGIIIDSGTITLNNLVAGIYELDFNTEHLEIATYNLDVLIEKTNYIERTSKIILKIIPREIDITLSKGFSENGISIYSGGLLNFEIELKDTTDDSYLIGAEVHLIFESKNYDLTDKGEGTYSFSKAPFKTISSVEKDYTATITAEKANYTTNEDQISINIKKRELDAKIRATNLKGHQINVVKGTDIVIEIELRDPTDGDALLTGASVIMTIEGEKYEFKEVSAGLYKYMFSTDEFESFMTTHTLAVDIKISKTNYISENIGIIIVIEMEEIFPGMPIFYFINIVIAVGAVGSILVAYFSIRHDRTSGLLLEDIKGKKSKKVKKQKYHRK